MRTTADHAGDRPEDWEVPVRCWYAAGLSDRGVPASGSEASATLRGTSTTPTRPGPLLANGALIERPD